MSENREENKFNYIFIIPFITILIASFIYFFYIGNFVSFDQTSQRFISILESLKELSPNQNIFIGDSQTREDINCVTIGDGNISCYNLGIEGILPIQIGLISNEIINSSPKRVIIGVSPLFFSESINKNEDIFFFIGEKKVKLDKKFISMLDKDEAKLISLNWFERGLYKRKFILPIYSDIIKNIIYKNNKKIVNTELNKRNNFKNPYIFNTNKPELELKGKINDTNIIKLFEFNSSVREVKAFEYLINNIRINKINITIVEMPINPILEEHISNKSKIDFSNYISKISSEYNISYLDISSNFNKDEFIDLTHLNEKGREKLSKIMKKGGENVIQ